jgi:pyrroline-5-carboxylate reductase
MRLGFIGTGHITAALVEGLCTADDPPAGVMVSPRNAKKAARLAARFSQVEVSESNQAIVDGCDCVFLALRTPVAPLVLREIRFRPNQPIISLIITHPLDQIRKLVEPARKIAWAVPLPSVARRLGPIAVYPDESFAVEILANVGKPVVVRDEQQLRILVALTALVCPFYSLIEETSRWATDAGVERDIAQPYTASMFHSLSALAMDASKGSFSDLVAESATPGGLNEQALKEIREQEGYKPFLNALDSILIRLGGKPPRQ